MLVSFIIPSYNSAHTVKRCLDSIYALSLKPEEFEVIFIDDCSTDNTVSIIEDLKSQASNLKLLRQPKNNRQGAARNRGVSVAKGEYICFVDSDDALTEGVVDAIRLAKALQTDMTAFHTANANEVGEITRETPHLSFPQGQLFSGVELQLKQPYWFSGPVAYIYSKAFLEKTNYPFREGVLYEDSDFVMAHLYYAQRMAYSPDLGYIAYYREGSTTHSMSYKNCSDYLMLGTRMLALYNTIQQDIDSCKRSDVRIQQFANGVLEGACWNVTKAVNRLYKLSGPAEIRAFYERVDSFIDRKELLVNKDLHRYFWNQWTTICLKHKILSVICNACLAILYSTYLKLRHKR